MTSETEQLNNTTHSYARSHQFNKNVFLKALFNMYSRRLTVGMPGVHNYAKKNSLVSIMFLLSWFSHDFVIDRPIDFTRSAGSNAASDESMTAQIRSHIEYLI